MMIRPALLITFVLAASTASISCANDPIPVVDASPGVAGKAGEQQQQRQLQGGLPANQPGSQLADMLYQQQMLQQEVQALRGIVEEQAHQIKRMREEQRDRYLDLDRRITLLSPKTAAASTATSTPADVAAVSTVVKEPVQAAASAAKASPAPVVSQASQAGNNAGAKEAYQTAFSLVRNKQYAEAGAAFEQLIKQYPDSNYTGNSYYWLGEVLLVESKREPALRAFETLLEKYPNHRKAPDAKFKQGKIYLLKGDKARAKPILQEVLDQYPESSAAKLAAAEIRDAGL